MDLASLPKVLKSLICELAYGEDLETVEKDIETCLEIKNMDLHPLFLRKFVWSHAIFGFDVTPLTVFKPISDFGSDWEKHFGVTKDD